MGGSVSAGHSNAELVYNLATQHASSKSSLVEQLMLGVDRRAYFLPDFEHFAYQDLAWKHNLIHLSAPVIYWEVLDQLQLKPGLSFLNLGSGTGYLSTMAGLVLGPNGINHGVEIHQEVIDFAQKKVEQFKQESESMDRYDFCEPQFVQGNCLYLPPDVRQYDRVYVGAACPDDKETYMKNLLKVGGILVMPFRDYLVQIKRVGPDQFKTTRSMQVAFSSLQDPPLESVTPVPHIKLPELHPRDLRDLARCRIRQLLRKCCETECPEVVQLKRFIPKRDVRSRLRVCSSSPGDMHQIISVGYSEQTDDDMSDNQSLEDHEHDDDDDVYEVRTLDPPTDSEASNDESNPLTKERSQDNEGEKNNDEKLELEEKLENVLNVSNEEQEKSSGRDEKKKSGSKQEDAKNRVKERPSRPGGGDNDDSACSSKSLFRKSSPRSSNVQKYVDKEPLTKLESARKFKQLLDEIGEIKCPGSSSKVNERHETTRDILDSDNNEELNDPSPLDNAVRSRPGSNDSQMIEKETELDDTGKVIDATEPTEQSGSLVGVKDKISDLDNKYVKNSHENVSSEIVKGAENAISEHRDFKEEPMDGVNDDVRDTNEKEGATKEHTMDTTPENLMDTSSEPVVTEDQIRASSSAISFKREKIDSGVVDDDFGCENLSNASLDSSGGSLDSGISYHSALNAYMESVREMKKTYANRHKAQSSFLKSLMDSARDEENNRGSENGHKKTLGELFGDGACTFGASTSREEVKTNLSDSASSGNAKADLSTKNIGYSSDTNKGGSSESDSCNTAKMSTGGALTSKSKYNFDETMESEDQPQPCSSKLRDQNEKYVNKTDKRNEADCNRELKNRQSSRLGNDRDLSYWKKNKSYPNQGNNRNNNKEDGNSGEEKNPNEEKLAYPTYAELQAMRQKLVAKVRDRTSSNDSIESDVESYFSNGRLENLSESRFADQSSSSGLNENDNNEECKPSGKNNNYSSKTKCQRNKPSGMKANEESKPSHSNISGDALISEEDLDEETYESKRKYTTDSEHGDDEGESNDDQTKKESSKKNKKFKDRNSERNNEEEDRRRSTLEAERLAQAAQRRDGLLNFLDEPPTRPLFHVFNHGIFEVMSPLRRRGYDEEVNSEDEDDDFVVKDVDKEAEEEQDDGQPTYTSLMKERIQALPLPSSVKRYLNYDRDF